MVLDTRKSLLFVLGFLLFIVSASTSIVINRRSDTSKALKIAYAGHWKTIQPGLQHTLIGDLTLSNQFESLVGFNENGVYVPLAAKSWTISSDQKFFRFKIDRNRKFSDGVPLSARHFKESWENSLKLDPKSANSSLLDILYKVEGFTEFRQNGTLKGLVVAGDDTLEIRFTTPFRMALEYLSGSRFSAYRMVNGKYLGTGAYVIESLSPYELVLRPNPHSALQAKTTINLLALSMSECLAALKDGKLDVMAYGSGAAVANDSVSKAEFRVLVGQDAIHHAINPAESIWT